MAVRKKGIFYTFSALFMLAIIFTWLFFNTSYRVGDDTELVEYKTATMNDFIASFDNDVQRGLYIAGYRALLSAESRISSSYAFLNDSVAAIEEAMINGSIDGAPAGMMGNSTLLEWLNRIKEAAVDVGIVVNVSYSGLLVTQTEPWYVDFYANLSYNITDTTNTAVFSRSISSDARVSIIGMRDPIYTYYTAGQIIRQINNTPYEGFYASGVNTSNLILHINQLRYANSTGPSYLMRLEGALDGTSSAGIESIVRLPDLQEKGFPVYERCSVDYVYFGNTTPTIYRINNTFEDWLRLDDAHLDKYQVRLLIE
jgi:hypothetical protein